LHPESLTNQASKRKLIFMQSPLQGENNASASFKKGFSKEVPLINNHGGAFSI